MLIALLTSFLISMFTGGQDAHDIDAARSRVKEVVVDKDTRREAMGVFDRASENLAEYEKQLADMTIELRSLVLDQEAPTQTVRAYLDEIKAVRDSRRQKQLDLRFELRELLTPEQWAVVFPYEAEES